MVWAFLGFLVFLALIVVAGLRNYRKIPVELTKMASGLGIALVRTWATPGEGRAGSPFQYGPCYTGTYRDLAVAVSTVVDNERGVMGTGLAFHFIRPLCLSLFCALYIDPFMATMIQDEYWDIYLNRVDTGIEALKAWARGKDKAMMLLRGGDVYTRLDRLAGIIQTINGLDGAALPGLRRAGFMVNDQGITLLVTDPSMLNRELVEEAFLLAQALSGSGFCMSGRSTAAPGRGVKVLVIILMVLFMGFVIGVMIVGIFKVKIAPVLSVWGLN